jgi:hypothetical protein
VVGRMWSRFLKFNFHSLDFTRNILSLLFQFCFFISFTPRYPRALIFIYMYILFHRSSHLKFVPYSSVIKSRVSSLHAASVYPVCKKLLYLIPGVGIFAEEKVLGVQLDHRYGDFGSHHTLIIDCSECLMVT